MNSNTHRKPQRGKVAACDSRGAGGESGGLLAAAL